MENCQETDYKVTKRSTFVPGCLREYYELVLNLNNKTKRKMSFLPDNLSKNIGELFQTAALRRVKLNSI